MAEFPVPLDNLIAYVKALHPDAGPLDNVSDAILVSARLDEQSDALIGYFVDQARRMGASWSQIGASMGVSKQAVQKRFVAHDGGGLVPEGQQMFSRFTQRARNVLAAAGRIAGVEPVGAAHLAAALLSEPEGLAARVIQQAGLTGDQVLRRGRGRARRAGPGRGRGGPARAELQPGRPGSAEGHPEGGSAARPQLHRHRARAARHPVRRRPECPGAGLARARR